MSLINVFTPSANDKSLQYLYRLFGDMNGLLGEGQYTAFALFGELFRTFNTIALTVGTLIVVYTTIIGVLKTAVEGEFLGKHWSSLWIPLRMVLGIAALVPTPSGYSGLQIVMMWVVMQGVGAADQVWSTALRYISVVGSPYTQSVQIPTMGVKTSMQQLFAILVCDQAMNQAGATAPAAMTKNDTSYDYGQGTKPFSADQIRRGTGTWMPNTTETYRTACGTFTMELGGSCSMGNGTHNNNPTSMMPVLECRVSNAQVTAMQTIVNEFKLLAQKVLEIDRAYQLFYTSVWKAAVYAPIYAASGQKNPWKAYVVQLYNSNTYYSTICDSLISAGVISLAPKQTKEDLCTSTTAVEALGKPASLAAIFQESPQNVVAQFYYPALEAMGIKSDFVQTSTNEYATAVVKPVNDYLTYLSQQIQEKKTELPAAYQQAEDSGWIFAGAYYYLLSQTNNASFNTAANVTFSVAPANYNDQRFQNVYTNLDTATYLAQAAAGSQTGGAGTSALANAGGPGGTAGAQSMQMVGDTATYTSQQFGNMLQQTKMDPLIALQAMGYVLLFLVPILYVGLLIILSSVSFLVSLSPSVLGTGIGSPGTGVYWTAIAFLFPMLFTLLTLLIGVGGLIGIYTPFVPYIIFIVGGLGWLLSIVETMVAGPLVALGILAPGGQHDVLGKAEPALGLLFANFLRPTLMIFGMFAAMLLAPIALDLLNGTFSMAMTSIAAMGGTGSSSVETGGNAAYGAGGASAIAFNPIMALFFLCVYVMLIITLLNKCFAAIHVIPERVMSWIQIQGAQYGEETALGEAKKGTEGAASGLGRSMDKGEGKAESGSAAAGTEKKAQDQRGKDEAAANLRRDEKKKK